MAPGPSEVYARMIMAIGDIGISVLIKLCQRILGGKESLQTEIRVLKFQF